jgi:ABC-2 type transport system permease protein
MSKALEVARWEYLEKVRSKAFLISLFVTPLVMVAMGLLPGLFASQEDEQTRTLGMIDQSGEVGMEFAQRMQHRYTLPNGQPNYVVVPLAVGRSISLEEEVAAANARVVSGELDGYCVVPSTIFSDSVVDYRTQVVGDFRVTARIREVLREILEEKRSVSLGIDPRVLARLKVALEVRTLKISTAGKEEESGFEKVFFTAYLFMMMLFFLIVTSGQLLVRSVIEEKSSRIVEILVSSCSPTELMAGKVLGLSALGITQMAFWALIGVALSLQMGVEIIDPAHAALLSVYFVLGYLLYAGVFITAGSPLTTEQEAQQVTTYLVLILIVPIVLAIPAMRTPDATWLKVLTFFPLLTPTMMALRIPVQMPSTAEILVSIAILVLSIYGTMVVAGRVFRIAILSTGKTPTISEIMRWIRTG